MKKEEKKIWRAEKVVNKKKRNEVNYQSPLPYIY